jgi:uncharacterized protein (DUF2126 family)
LATSSRFKLFSQGPLLDLGQAPRIDEGRDEKLYEMEIAFEQIQKIKKPFWMVDRIFRNLLTDMEIRIELNFVSINYIRQIHRED